MNKREAIRQNEQESRLLALGFTRDEAEALRRISMTLRRWYELECGDGNDYGSWAIERDECTDIPYMVRHHYRHGHGKDTVSKTRIPDREKGAIKRLKKIIDTRNARITDDHSKDAEQYIHATCKAKLAGFVSYYLQTDPRGANLYIIRPGDVPEDKNVSAYHDRGLCVY